MKERQSPVHLNTHSIAVDPQMSNREQAYDGLCSSHQGVNLCPNALPSLPDRPILLRSYAIIADETYVDYLQRARYMDALHARRVRDVAPSDKIVAVAKNINGEDVFEMTLLNGETILVREIERNP